MKILLICTESYSACYSPLAEAVGHIALAYRKQGASVLGFCPFFTKFEQHNKYEECGKHKERLRNMEYAVLKRKNDNEQSDLFIRFDDYFGRDGIYGDKIEKSYSDNHLRFSFLVSSAMDYCLKTGFKPDAIHVHEWSGIAGALAKTVYKEFENIPVTLTIHNIRYDFHCTPRHIQKIGLPGDGFNIDGYEFWGKVSLLKAAILYSDKVAFTSEAYLHYVLSTDLPGGMRGFLESQQWKLLGIQNGLDYEAWTVPENVEEFKNKMKNELRAELGLEADSSMLIYSQFDFDSSAMVISTVLANLLNMNLQLVLGISEDDANYPYFVSMQEKNSSKMAIMPITEDWKSLYRRLVAADIFFSISGEDPSLSIFLKAGAAGSIPLSSKRTGKSLNFLKPFSELALEDKDKANSFIAAEVSPDLILEQLQIAESIFCENKSLWYKLVSNASSFRATWSDTAKKYFSTFTLNS